MTTMVETWTPAYEGDAMTPERHAALFADIPEEDARTVWLGGVPADTTPRVWEGYKAAAARVWAMFIMREECDWWHGGDPTVPAYASDSTVLEYGIRYAVACRAMPGLMVAVVTDGVGYAAVEIANGGPHSHNALAALAAGEWDEVRDYLCDQIRIMLRAAKSPHLALGEDPRPLYVKQFEDPGAVVAA